MNVRYPSNTLQIFFECLSNGKKKLINYRESSKIDVNKMVYGQRIKQYENGMKENARKCHMQQKD